METASPPNPRGSTQIESEAPAGHSRLPAGMRRTWQGFTQAFKSDGKMCWPLVAIFVIINGIVFYNAVFHNPRVQYDSTGHLANVRILSTGHLPAATESGEFFSAPLAYFLPAALLSTGQFPLVAALKIAQLLNFLLSLGLTFTLLKIADDLFAGRVQARLISLGMLGLLPVYYRTFAFVRGEPYVAFLTLLAIHQTLRIFGRKKDDWLGVTLLGLTLGLDILARQWAFFFFPALFLFGALCVRAERSRFKAVVVRLGLASLLAVLVGGWFYVSLYQRYGTLTAFNHAPGGQLHASQPLSFYTGLGLSSLFSKPVRPELKNRLFPILYSDVWGDYWGYFLIYVIDGRTGNQVAGANFENAVLGPPHAWLLSDYDSFGPYLGEVNLVSMLPSLVLVAGIVYGLGELIKSIRPPAGMQSVEASWLLSLSLVFALAGYFWFLIGYSTLNSGGDTIKASYILQAYPLCALLVANLFEKVPSLRAKEKWLWVLGLVFLNNFPALLTHFFLPPW